MKQLIFTITFALAFTSGFGQTEDSTATQPVPEEEIFTVVQEMPEAIVPDHDLNSYFHKNLKNPEGHIGKTILWVSLLVNKDGTGQDIKVIKVITGSPGTEEACKAEAKRVLELIKWKPGKQAGRPVPVRYTLPVKFQ